MWDGEPSENESGVALNIAIINGVSFNDSGLVVGMMGTRDRGCRERRTEIGSLSVGWTNVGEILLISYLLPVLPPSLKVMEERRTRSVV